MGKPVALLGHMHSCPVVEPGPKPHTGGPVVSAGQTFVRVNGLPVAVVGGTCTCTGLPGPDRMVSGSAIARIDGRAIMRIGDATAHGGRIVAGFPGLRSD